MDFTEEQLKKLAQEIKDLDLKPPAHNEAIKAIEDKRLKLRGKKEKLNKK